MNSLKRYSPQEIENYGAVFDENDKVYYMEDGDYFTEDGYYYTADGYDENGGYFDDEQGKHIPPSDNLDEEELKKMDEEADEEEAAYRGIGEYNSSKLGIHGWDKPKKGSNSAAK